MDGVGHGYWMLKLRVVEFRICRGSGGFGLGDEGLVPLGCSDFWGSVGVLHLRAMLQDDPAGIVEGIDMHACNF